MCLLCALVQSVRCLFRRILSVFRIKITMLSLASQMWGIKPHRNKSKLLVSILPHTLTGQKGKKNPNKVHILLTDKAVVLKHHPDKRRAAGEQITEGDNDYFTCITKGLSVFNSWSSKKCFFNLDFYAKPTVFSSSAYVMFEHQL